MTLIQFDSVSGARIGDAVRYVESQANRRRPLVFDGIPPHSAQPIRMVTFTGPWAIGTLKTCTIKDTTRDITVDNQIVDIGVDCGTRNAIVFRTAGHWQLINAQRG